MERIVSVVRPAICTVQEMWVGGVQRDRRGASSPATDAGGVVRDLKLSILAVVAPNTRIPSPTSSAAGCRSRARAERHQPRWAGRVR